jgi:CSLREA domain-containing protein
MSFTPSLFLRPRPRVAAKAIGAAAIALAMTVVPITRWQTTSNAATVFTVNTTADAVDADVTDGICEANVGAGDCTLRAAVQQAVQGSDPGPHEIIIDPTVAASSINLTLAGAGEDASATGDLDIQRGVVRIRAGGTNTTRLIAPGALIQAGTLGDRFFQVFPGATLELSGVSMEGAASTVDGGGIHNAGSLRIDNTVFPATTHQYMTAISSSVTTGRGGAIYNASSGLVTIEAAPTTGNVIFNANQASEGGALYNDGGTVTVISPQYDGPMSSDVYFDESAASIAGGGIYNAVGGVIQGGCRFAIRFGDAPDGGNVFNAGTLDFRGASLDRGGVVTSFNPLANVDRGGNLFNAPTGQVTLGSSECQSVSSGGEAADGGGIYNLGTIDAVSFVSSRENVASSRGGAAYLGPNSRLQVSGLAQFGSAGPDRAPRGASIFAEGATIETVGAAQMFVSGNEASVSGGGLELTANSQFLISSGTVTIERNVAPDGGGMVVSDSIVRGSNIAMYQNRASVGNGGGLLARPGAAIDLTRSVWFANEANGSGGALHADGPTAGDVSVRLLNSTMSANTATNGAAVFATAGSIELTHVTVADSRGNALTSGAVGAIAARRSIITDSSGQNCASGTVISLNEYNVFGDSSCGSGATDIVRSGSMIPTLLAPYLSYDPLHFHALEPGNPAIDLVPSSLCPAPSQDQRREPRPSDSDGDGTSLCDAGAIEAQQLFSISGRVLAADSDGPLEGVCAYPVDAGGDFYDPGRTSASGEYQISGLEAGSYHIAFLECDTDNDPLGSPNYEDEWYDDVALDLNNPSPPASAFAIQVVSNITGIDACLGLLGVTSSPLSDCGVVAVTTTSTTTTAPSSATTTAAPTTTGTVPSSTTTVAPTPAPGPSAPAVVVPTPTVESVNPPSVEPGGSISAGTIAPFGRDQVATATASDVPDTLIGRPIGEGPSPQQLTSAVPPTLAFTGSTLTLLSASGLALLMTGAVLSGALVLRRRLVPRSSR